MSLGLRRSVAASATALLLATLAACDSGGEKPAAVKEKASQAPSEITQDSSSPSPEEVTESAAPATAAMGDLVTVGHWDVKVTDLVIDAADQMHKANLFNDKAKGVYVLVTYEATYTGPERTADIFADLSWSFTTTDQQIHETAVEVTPAEDQEWPTEARQNGTVRSQAVFDLDKSMVKGGLLTVEGYDDSYETIYADFTV